MSRSLDSLIKRWFGHMPAKRLLAASFGLMLLTTTLVTGLWLSRSGDRLVDDMMSTLATGTQQQLQREFDDYFSVPDKINRYTADSIRGGRVDLNSPESLAAFFHDSPWRTETGAVSGIYFGDPAGEFTGMGADVRADSDASWTFLRASPGQTGGRLLYIPPMPDGSFSDAPVDVGPFDPRKRPWYESAVDAAGNGVWSGVYANAVSDIPTITRSRTVYDDQGNLLGVTGVDLFFFNLQDFLEQQSVGEHGEVFVYDGAGELLGAYAPDSVERRVSPSPLLDDRLHFSRAASRYVRSSLGGFGKLLEPVSEQVQLDGEDGFLYVGPLAREQGLDWSLGVFLPRSDYHSPSLTRMLPLLLLMTGLIWLSMTGFIHLIVKPMMQLRKSALRIATGDFDTYIDLQCSNEIGELAQAVDDMRANLKSSFADLSRQKRRAESTLLAIADGVITVDGPGVVLYMNAAASRLTGVPCEAALGQPVAAVFRAIDGVSDVPMPTQAILDLRHDKRKGARAITLLGPEGCRSPIHCRVSMIEHEDPGKAGNVVVFRDLSEERRLESELLHHATHDGLTDLINRREFKRRLGLAIESAQRRDLQHVVCYIDLDRFKVVNDTCGHAAGDALLRQLARLFETKLRTGDIVARLGGDEFGLLLENCSLAQALPVMQKLHEHIADFRFHWHDRSFGVGMSSGLTRIDRSVGTSSEVMREADGACFVAKESGRNQLHLYQEDDEKLSQRRGEMRWLEILQRALDADGFILYAQGISRSDALGKPARHFEVLLRLRDRDGNIVSPERFLPAAERYGMATRIDRWVVNHTLQWLAAWPDPAACVELCSINLSGQSVGDTEFQRFLLDAIDAWQVPAELLCFEITETASIANLSLATQLIHNLQARGCRFALDDFGSGFSSFAYLKSLPVNYLKIDGLFVRDIGANPLDLAMVRSINEVGHTMGMQTIAEFVETPEVAEQLRGLNVDFLQGFGIGAPMPINEFFQGMGQHTSTGT